MDLFHLSVCQVFHLHQKHPRDWHPITQRWLLCFLVKGSFLSGWSPSRASLTCPKYPQRHQGQTHRRPSNLIRWWACSSTILARQERVIRPRRSAGDSVMDTSPSLPTNCTRPPYLVRCKCHKFQPERKFVKSLFWPDHILPTCIPWLACKGKFASVSLHKGNNKLTSCTRATRSQASKMRSS